MAHITYVTTGTPIGTFLGIVGDEVVTIKDIIPKQSHGLTFAFITIHQADMLACIVNPPIQESIENGPFGHFLEEGTTIELRNKRTIDQFKCIAFTPEKPVTLVISVSAYGDFDPIIQE